MTAMLPAKRFDLVVVNYNRLPLLFENFDRIQAFDQSRDRLTILSCSPSPAETALIDAFEADSGITVRRLTRENKGVDQLPRCEYFTGQVGSLEENLAYSYVFHFQEHYLDLDSPAARWGPEFDYRIKGDVVPDGVVFDLDRIEALATQHDLHGLFADRNDPCYMELNGSRFVTPNGTNFFIRTDLVAEPSTQRTIRRMIRCYDGYFPWGLWVEYNWGPIFFHEGRRFYDLKRERLFDRWEEDEFYVSGDPYPELMDRYGKPEIVQAARRARERLQQGWARADVPLDRVA